MEPKQTRIRFSREEAQAKIGRRVRSTVEFDGIEAGTPGCVMEIDEIEPGGFELIIEWESRVEGKFQHDWFSKEQYESCLVDES